jgi:hypothetical protein
MRNPKTNNLEIRINMTAAAMDFKGRVLNPEAFCKSLLR